MAYARIPQRFDDGWLFLADSDSDVTTIASENPDAPVGSVVIADNSGSTAVHLKFPSGDFSQLSQ